MPEKQYPFYFKSTVILFGLILFTFILLTLRDILVPFAFSLIIAILLNPLVNKFNAYGVKKVVSISLAMLIAFALFGGILYFLSSQIVGFGENFGLLKQKFAVYFQVYSNGCRPNLACQLKNKLPW